MNAQVTFKFPRMKLELLLVRIETPVMTGRKQHILRHKNKKGHGHLGCCCFDLKALF